MEKKGTGNTISKKTYMKMTNRKVVRLAIIGASYLQVPLIIKAKEMGLETHVFAWQVGDEGEQIADYFYPISIVEKEEICEKCREIGIRGICSIASDLAVITVNYVAQKLNLAGNSEECTKLSTNKFYMREALQQSGLPIPQVYFSGNSSSLKEDPLQFPLICKPTDRSGSRGVSLVNNYCELKTAMQNALEESLEKKVILEEYVEGKEYSVECISWKGNHSMLAITEKITTGAPNFIEKGQLQPAEINEKQKRKIEEIIYKALDALKIENGASHSEFKIDTDGNVKIIEIGSRMGGDLIGSHLVYLTTGIDFTKLVVDVALGTQPTIDEKRENKAAAVCFIFEQKDIEAYKKIKKEFPDTMIEECVDEIQHTKVTDSATRNGFFVMASDDRDRIRECVIGFGGNN